MEQSASWEDSAMEWRGAGVEYSVDTVTLQASSLKEGNL